MIQYRTKKRHYISSLLEKVGLEVVEFSRDLTNRKVTIVKVKTLWGPDPEYQTLKIFTDWTSRGLQVNFKFSKWLDVNFKQEGLKEAMVKLNLVKDFVGPNVNVTYTPYRRASSRSSKERPDSCYLRLTSEWGYPWNPTSGIYRLVSHFCLE